MKNGQLTIDNENGKPPVLQKIIVHYPLSIINYHEVDYENSWF